MSLISLLIALAAERYLSTTSWQFKTYFHAYVGLFKRSKLMHLAKQSIVSQLIFIAIPVIACDLLLELVDDGLLYLVFSTLILIVCFGCVKTRQCYKDYLLSAFRGEPTTCGLHHRQLQQDTSSAPMSFGQLLVWLNYRYFIAIMIFFVVFGPAGALFYRLLVTMNESPEIFENVTKEESVDTESDEADINVNVESKAEATPIDFIEKNKTPLLKDILFWVDWLPVRLVAFGYMLVGHFSKAIAVWLENFFDINKQPNQILISVAQKSEDFMVDADDCTAEPCLLVRLAKRTLLLCLAVISVLILTGILN
ncbi:MULTISPECIES: beta-lactamase regulator AmpE [unclassified Colwellia]|uniref:beta-lactamase regulator AmpE n=1 Tax=unclassified Colwellia TaxID=196834 RepID=UPI0015F4C3F1|nr:MULTISPECIES: beta-lactamase regulator AmpE [unclassified Colwellia]MBA6233276.1 beta-lactamase regulator AmpE [Colwellia sp. MB02u-7]MBA6236366.1 beta-lactamase regulator AmpE [Colwellia sp. MB02u-11]MBA6256900.1 beta-lactamase regulator AmpE [Colwellia sp. MB3u-28]MBA6261094.1 beta-lactamase regulator AmpE [Colwellia sp. MB3u-41]MBA6298234.1 beta-lactamase regulator AmpE [Colwellia sp. MB3u-22]